MRLKLIILFVIFMLMIFFISCSSPIQSSSYAANTVAKTSVPAITKSKTTTTLKETADSSKEINAFIEKVNETQKYMGDFDNASHSLLEDIADLDNKRMEAAKTNDLQKALAYVQVEKDKYQELINNISKIFVPEIWKDNYSYILDSLTYYKQFYSYLIDSYNNNNNFDNAKATSLKDSAANFDTKASQEFKRILESLNKEAESLGLEKPFPY